MDFYKILHIIRDRKWVFSLCFCLALMTAILIPRQSKPQTYVSSAKVLLTPPSGADMVTGGREMGRWWFADEGTLRELVSSEHLLLKVIARLKLADDWNDLKKNVTLSTMQGASGRYYGSGSVSLFDITVEAESSKKSKEISDALIDEFVLYIQELSAQEFANTRRFLEELVTEAREKVEATEGKLLAITSTREASADDKDMSRSESELEAERLKVRDRLATAEAELGAVTDFTSGKSATPPWSIMQQDGSMLRSLEAAVSENRLKLVEVSELYNAENQHVKDQNEKLQKVSKLYEDHVSQAADSLVRDKSSMVGTLRQQLDRVNAQLSELRKRRLSPSEKRKVAQLERQLNTWDENHLSLVKQLYQARVVEQSSRRQGAISILQRPGLGIVPKDKKLPSLVKSLGFGLPFALVFSTAAVLLLDYLTSSMQLLPRIEQSLGLPILVVVPVISDEMAVNWEALKRKAGSTTDRVRPKSRRELAGTVKE